MDPTTDVGPLVNKHQVRVLHSQVSEAVSKGARLLTGGKLIPGAGAFYQPTVLDRVGAKMRVMREEVFGPVAPIHVVADGDEALKSANESVFGLGASVWTNDPAKASSFASRVESGMVFINGLVKSDPRMPFGGVKRSGIGRELSKHGLREFVNVKSVNMYGIGRPDLPGSPTNVE